ncbi:MAG TPA: tetratricopeptide repeat protein [Streptosporangiaceae bacterium]
MTTDQDITELLAAGDEALAEAGFRTGDFTAARELLERAAEAAGKADDKDGSARAANSRAMVLHYDSITKLMTGEEPDRADVDAEERLFRQALAHWQGTGNHADSAQSLFGLGLVYQVLHRDWMTAMPYYWQALDLVTKPDSGADLYLRSEVHRHVGFYFHYEAGQPAEAVRHLQLSLDLREELGDPRRIPSGLVALGEAELAAGNRDRAVELLRRAVAQARGAGLTSARIEATEQALREAEAGGSQPQPDQATPATAGTDATAATAAGTAETADVTAETETETETGTDTEADQAAAESAADHADDGTHAEADQAAAESAADHADDGTDADTE